ncbi:hypothetical protein [Bryocella elongata]|uniref:hypothetical protein n=1 Tax=Bryocella elongata TaxID=863522 RepID=UPI0011B08F2C|nr:hypothetical protein [Bryocella elongata]
MRVTIDIPEATYETLRALAAAQEVPVDQVVADQLRKLAGIPATPEELAKRFPLIKSKHPNSITSEQVAEFDFLDPS